MTLMQKTIKKENTGQVPIWFMRQAGRYLPEYRKLKEGRDFMQLVMDPELASEITLQPVNRLDVDAAIIFSDIMVILHALDLDVSFATGAPEIHKVVRNLDDLNKVKGDYSKEKLISQLGFYTKAIQLTRERLDESKSLIGFAAAPFTLASYMIEGKTSKTHARVRANMYEESGFFADLMQFIADSTIDYLNLQIDAGVDVVQLFDSWGDSLDTQSYLQNNIPYIKQIAQAISKRVPVIFFCRGASIHRNDLLDLYESGVSVISMDWRLPIDTFGDHAVQGNLDPAVLLTNPETVTKKTLELLSKRGSKPGYIFNLGHGIYPETPVENVEAMVKTVKEFRS